MASSKQYNQLYFTLRPRKATAKRFLELKARAELNLRRAVSVDEMLTDLLDHYDNIDQLDLDISPNDIDG